MLYTTTIMISITTVIQTHIHIQMRIQIQNTGGLCCFRYEQVYKFLTSVLDDGRGDTQFLKVYANHTMLTPPPRAAHLVMFKNSVSRDPKNPTTSFNGQNSTPASMVQSQLTLFHYPPILRTISSGHDVIHTPASFPVWGFIMTNDDCYILCSRA